jgi:hypothetical protein
MSLHWEDPLIGNLESRAFRREKLHQDPSRDVTFGSIRATSCQMCLASSVARRSRAATGQPPAPSPGSATATCSSTTSAYWPPTMTPPKCSTCSSTPPANAAPSRSLATPTPPGSTRSGHRYAEGARCPHGRNRAGAPGRIARLDADHEFPDRGCRGSPAADVVPFAGDQSLVPGEQRRRGHREHLAPSAPGIGRDCAASHSRPAAWCGPGRSCGSSSRHAAMNRSSRRIR